MRALLTRVHIVPAGGKTITTRIAVQTGRLSSGRGCGRVMSSDKKCVANIDLYFVPGARRKLTGILGAEDGCYFGRAWSKLGFRGVSSSADGAIDSSHSQHLSSNSLTVHCTRTCW